MCDQILSWPIIVSSWKQTIKKQNKLYFCIKLTERNFHWSGVSKTNAKFSNQNNSMNHRSKFVHIEKPVMLMISDTPALPWTLTSFPESSLNLPTTLCPSHISLSAIQMRLRRVIKGHGHLLFLPILFSPPVVQFFLRVDTRLQNNQSCYTL